MDNQKAQNLFINSPNDSKNAAAIKSRTKGKDS